MGKEKVLDILKEIRPEYDFEKSEDFVAEGLLDSFDVVTLVSELETEFDIVIDGLDVVPENFNNIASILEVLKKNGAAV
ncbi:MAG: acyl carrier protein [Schwartzia succinivorans]|uniref:phosphopantetheine-binding protein n=1 Tax=Schwartzia succinivorans TaxID=55507 RepID=UPI002356D14C|nr:phosphopantetheine-binding protein [Schwartzia succinivorans]MBE6096534.1 acyl carrier protein [Schwartzia succinivorans]